MFVIVDFVVADAALSCRRHRRHFFLLLLLLPMFILYVRVCNKATRLDGLARTPHVHHLNRFNSINAIPWQQHFKPLNS